MPDSYGQRPKKADVLTCMRCAKEAGRDGASIRRCGRCNRATYCGKECQTMDWPTHKIECRQIVQEMELLRLADQLRADGANLPINFKIPTNLSLVTMKKDLHDFVERYRKQVSRHSLLLSCRPHSSTHE
ncbi:hypothetical protein FRC02_011292 [Tulasnella sp. 418]|nr:hypothetical protein FRC02_011292 [Tulasnella sp. 418]